MVTRKGLYSLFVEEWKEKLFKARSWYEGTGGRAVSINMGYINTKLNKLEKTLLVPLLLM